VEVRTDRETYSAGRVVVSAGAWAADLLADLKLPLEIRRKPLYWFRTRGPAYRADGGCPGYLFETTDGVFYGFPQIDPQGIKAAEHSGGRTVADPLAVDRAVDAEETARLERFLGDHLPDASREVSRFAVCMYTMTPDENFILDRHPTYPQIAFAAGLSGHGFKLAGALGEALVELALNGAARRPIQCLSVGRPALHLGRR
jgi:glycine/D-amino acid oxidase-like deaminating enzyme